MVLVEVVSNPTLRVADMEGIARLARERGLMLAVDNTFTTPRAYRPFAHGADVVIHSLTKLLAGHSDVTLGWIAARTPEMNRALYDAIVTWGMTPSPFDCWLAERGLHSFRAALRPGRGERQAAGRRAGRGRRASSACSIPAAPTTPTTTAPLALLGERTGNMVSFRLDGGRETVNRFLRAAEHIAFAPTLGDIGTTLSHPASSSHRGLTPEGRAALGITEGFIRVRVGCEDADQLVAEVAGAVAASRS